MKNTNVNHPWKRKPNDVIETVNLGEIEENVGYLKDDRGILNYTQSDILEELNLMNGFNIHQRMFEECE